MTDTARMLSSPPETNPMAFIPLRKSAPPSILKKHMTACAHWNVKLPVSLPVSKKPFEAVPDEIKAET